jgi:hypothetical protein
MITPKNFRNRPLSRLFLAGRLAPACPPPPPNRFLLVFPLLAWVGFPAKPQSRVAWPRFRLSSDTLNW